MNEPDPFVEQLKNRVDLMSEDQLLYLFIPEMLYIKKEAEECGEIERVIQIEQVLKYVGSKIELDNGKVFDLEKRAKFIIPTPDEIINGKTDKDVPNN